MTSSRLSTEDEGAGKDVALLAAVVCAALVVVRFSLAGEAAIDVVVARWLVQESPLLGQSSGWLPYGAVVLILEALAAATTAWVSATVLRRLGYRRRFVVRLNIAAIVLLQATLAALSHRIGF